MISCTIINQPINIKQTQEVIEPRGKSDNENTQLSDKKIVSLLSTTTTEVMAKATWGGEGFSHPIGCSPSLRERSQELKAGPQRQD